ncbi:MAG: hypothetical protein QXH80_01300 [Candidatus Nanoarchaeia archaeon]
MANKRKIFAVVGISLSAILLILVLVLLLLMAMLFDRNPYDVKNNVPDSAALSLAMAKLTGSLATSNEDSDNPLSFLTGILTGSETKIEWNKDETNALITAGIASRRAATEGKEILPNVIFSDGRFKVEYSARMKFSTPFGNYINIYAEAIPQISDGHLSVNIIKAKVGTISLPTPKITELANREIRKKENDEEMQKMLKIIKKLNVKNDSVEIVYDRGELAMLMLEKANIGNMLK